MRRALGLVALGWGLVCYSAAAQAAVFHPETYTLSNGMRVVLVGNTLSDAVVQMVWYRVGGVDDPAGRSGAAHFLEHLMFKGTEAVPEGAFSSIIAQMGGQDNAFTTPDSTSYYVTVSREHLARVMMMEADRMRGLVIDPAAALTELDVVRSERQERTDNKPQGLFEEKMRAALFGAHPYGRPVIGTPQDLAAMTPRDARAFYDTYYAPDHAILVLSGNVQAKDALALADATFGRLPKGAARKPMVFPAVQEPREKNFLMRDARVKQPYWTKRIVAPNVREDARRAAALEVLAETLTGGEVGLLYKEFVMRARSASAIDASYDSTARGPAVFAFAAVPVQTEGTDKLARSVKKALSSLAVGGVPEAEIRQAKQRMQDAAIFARDRLMAPAQILGEALATGGSLADVEEWPARIARVTKAEVDAALRDLLRSPLTVEGQLLPEKGAGK